MRAWTLISTAEDIANQNVSFQTQRDSLPCLCIRVHIPAIKQILFFTVSPLLEAQRRARLAVFFHIISLWIRGWKGFTTNTEVER